MLKARGQATLGRRHTCNINEFSMPISTGAQLQDNLRSDTDKTLVLPVCWPNYCCQLGPRSNDNLIYTNLGMERLCIAVPQVETEQTQSDFIHRSDKTEMYHAMTRNS